MTIDDATDMVSQELPTFLRMDAPTDALEAAELRQIASAAVLYVHGATGVTDYSDARVLLLVKCVAQDMYAQRTTESGQSGGTYVAKGNAVRNMIRTMQDQLRIGGRT